MLRLLWVAGYRRLLRFCRSADRKYFCSPVMKPTHICPPFCHRCPDMGGDIMPWCGGPIEGRGFESCYCTNMVCACGRAAEQRCTWPTETMVPSLARYLLHGDVCSNLSNTRIGTVIEIEPVESV